MVKVCLDPDFARVLQQVDQILIEETLGQRHGHPRADADDVDMVDGRQLVDEPTELRHRQRQRVAARDDHVANFFVLADVLHHPLIVVAGTVPTVAIHGDALRVQNRQYIVQTCVVTISTRSG